VVCKLKGGLGNQLFQFAYGYARALELAAELELDVSYFDSDARHGGYALDSFKLNQTVALIKNGFLLNALFRLDEGIIGKFHSRVGHFEDGLGADDRVFKLGNTLYLNGFWQNPALFLDYTEQIKKALTLNEIENSYEYLQIKDQIINGASVAVHFRRGDYVSDKGAASVHGVLQKSYYEKAVRKIEEAVDKPTFFIFSDDIDAAKRELDFIENAIFVIAVSDNVVADMYLMSLCKHNIIANSTYSWWSAWLNESEKKIVIAPFQWFVNKEMNQKCKIIPSEWITV
jgi:hypothetical protein